MGSPKADLAVLSRSQPRGSEIPPPGTRWKTRVAVPLALLTLFAGLLAYTGRDLIWPAREVRIVPVVVKRAAETSGGTIFQAAGWVEPDPFPIYVTALSSGVVDKVHVLEGQHVSEQSRSAAWVVPIEIEGDVYADDGDDAHHQGPYRGDSSCPGGTQHH